MAKKTIPSPEPPVNRPFRRIYVPDVKERLETARRHLVLAEGALSADGDGAFETYDYAKAAKGAIVAAHEEIYWLMELSDDILNEHAPDGDQEKELEAGAEPPDRDGAR